MGDAGQVSKSAAEIYDEFFVPALFGTWPPRIVSALAIAEGMQVVDVACGTGVLTLEACARVGPSGRAIGVDLNPGMLEVARRKSSDVTWVEAPAEALPFEDETMDAVICQFGLMFFEDPRAAVAEMSRVLKTRGRLGIAVWDSLDRTPGYAAVVGLLARLFGESIADLLRSPYSLGDPDLVRQLVAHDALEDVSVERLAGTATFPSVRDWMHTDVRGWTLSDKLDDDQYERLVAEAELELAHFVGANGTVSFSHPAIVATATRSSR